MSKPLGTARHHRLCDEITKNCDLDLRVFHSWKSVVKYTLLVCSVVNWCFKVLYVHWTRHSWNETLATCHVLTITTTYVCLADNLILANITMLVLLQRKKQSRTLSPLQSHVFFCLLYFQRILSYYIANTRNNINEMYMFDLYLFNSHLK